MRLSLWVLVAVAFGAAASGYGQKVDLSKFSFKSRDFNAGKGVFAGSWPYETDWEGLICDGSYHTDTTVNGRIKDIHGDLGNDLTLSVSLTTADMVLGVDSRYQGDLSACETLSLGHQITIDSAKVLAKATVTDNPKSEKPVINVQITSTELGNVVYDQYFPTWLNDDITDGLNATLEAVWSSKIGEWIGDILSNQLNQNIPAVKHP